MPETDPLRSALTTVRSVLRLPYFPLVDSRRVYRQHGLRKAMKWFMVRLLVPLGVSQKRNTNGTGALEGLCRTGFAVLPARSKVEVDQLIDHFVRTQSKVDTHEYRSLGEYFDHWRLSRVLRPSGVNATGDENCPITQLARDPLITHLVLQYLNLPAKAVRVQATIDALIRIEGQKVLLNEYDGAVEFHRDIDSWKWVKVFVYLTKTEEGDGHHEMFPGSHLRTPLSLAPIRRYRQTEIAAAMPELRVAKIFGPSGYSFVENTFTFHRGTEPARNDRLMLTITYLDDSVAPWMYPNDTFSL
jgi:hypothetical protein